jgi:hypothetical protein
VIALFRKILNKGTETEDVSAVKADGDNRFVLKIKDLVIGHLWTEDGQWVYEYSEDFRNQDYYARLTGFSKLDKTYRSKYLWPFFQIRIPGLKQPMIKEIIRDENLDASNEAVLLRRFGRLSMSNPYVLEVG